MFYHLQRSYGVTIQSSRGHQWNSIPRRKKQESTKRKGSRTALYNISTGYDVKHLEEVALKTAKWRRLAIGPLHKTEA